jgi:hypothetical protein
MARVVNELIDVMLSGPARVKQYAGAGPLIVKLPGDRGEYRAQSGDYLCYDGASVVGIVGGPYFDDLREDKDTLSDEEIVTGAHLETTILDNAGAPLAGTTVLLGQGGVPLAEGRTDDAGLVYFNVLPGTYQVRPKDATRGPEQTVEAVLETEAVPPPVNPTRASKGTGSSGAAKGARFDASGKADPSGAYDSKGVLLSK